MRADLWDIGEKKIPPCTLSSIGEKQTLYIDEGNHFLHFKKKYHQKQEKLEDAWQSSLESACSFKWRFPDHLSENGRAIQYSFHNGIRNVTCATRSPHPHPLPMLMSPVTRSVDVLFHCHIQCQTHSANRHLITECLDFNVPPTAQNYPRIINTVFSHNLKTILFIRVRNKAS